jgi:transcription elongation GreA/GreB family factor
MGAVDLVGDRVGTPRGSARRLFTALTEGAVVSVADQLRDHAGRARAPAKPARRTRHADALEEHALLERQIAALRHTLALMKVLDYDADGTAGIGAYVRLRTPNGASTRYQPVGPAEAEPSQFRISMRKARSWQC